MQLKENDIALDFETKDIYGNEFRLSDYRGKKILLGFYRNVNCPFCNRRIHKIMGNNVMLRKQNVQLVFMFESSVERLSKSVFHQGISPWPLVSDQDLSIYRKYGVEKSLVKNMRTMFESNLFKAKAETKLLNLPGRDSSESQTLIPADFFINEDFRIVKAHYGKHLDDHVDFGLFKDYAGIGYDK